MRAYFLIGSLLVLTTIACNSTTEKDADAGIISNPLDGQASVDLPLILDRRIEDSLNHPDTDEPTLDVAIGHEGGSDFKVDVGPWDVATLDGSHVDASIPDTQPSADSFEPGPVVPIVVNSGNTATYTLPSGQWKRFSFPAEAGQIYTISEITDSVVSYLGANSDVSPKNYMQKGDAEGVIIFTAPATQTYYLAVSVEGDKVLSVSSSFQVADGGKRLALGANSVALTAPTGSESYFFHFPITPGKSYQCTLTGTSKLSLSFSPAPRAERMGNGQPAWPLFGLGSGLPMSEEIPATSVAKSMSGYYFLYVNVHEAMTLNITLTEN